MKKTLISMLAAAAAIVSVPAIAFSQETITASADATVEPATDAVTVTVDRAKVFRISRPASTVIIGNPSIVDATVEDDRTLVLTGRSFGVTNLIILDKKGDPVVDRTVVVRGHESNTLRIYRRSSRETMACAPVCEPTLTIGDDQATFTSSNQQIRQRNALSEGGDN